MNTDYFKKKLEAELDTVEEELGTVGVQNPRNPSDWEPKETEMEVTSNENSELGDKMEEFAEHTAINDALEIRYNDIKAALEKIRQGKYGVCEIGGEPIEEKRLEADSAARTCIAHKDEK